SRVPSRAGSISSHGRKSITPARYVINHPPVVNVIKPIMIFKDLKLQVKSLPEKEFALPQSMYTPAVLKQTKSYCRNLVHLKADAKFRPVDRVKIQKIEKKDEKTASPAPSTSFLQRQPLIGVKKPIDFPVTAPQASHGRSMNYAQVMAHKEANRAAASNSSLSNISLKPVDSSHKEANKAATSNSSLSTISDERAAASNQQTPISSASIISLKPADSSLLPQPAQPVIQKDNPDVKQKKVVLESLVNRISLTKREDGSWRMRSPSASSPALTTPSSAESVDAEGRKNKRKSSDPSKFITEDESSATVEKPKRSYKKRGGRKPPPPKKRKIEEVESEEPVQIDQPETEDNGLPPRIIVEGQEPGTELEWDEEEIIILRVGEEPEQRPPRMKRKMAPKEKFEEEMKEMEEAEEGERDEPSSMDTTLEDEQLSTAPVSLNSSQSSVYAADVSSNLSVQSSQGSSNGCSPTVLSALTAVICVPALPPIASSLPSRLPLTPPPPSLDALVPLHSIPLPPVFPLAPLGPEKRDSLDSNASSVDSTSTGGGRRAKRAVRTRARYSPTPEDGSSISRCSSQTTLDSTGLHVNHQISPI
ncbi:hypothetical protein PENTCL1PPCAC_13355, partial [Pristionchus entomophagus]